MTENEATAAGAPLLDAGVRRPVEEREDKAMNWKQKALYELMSEISEDCYCAGWMHGNEYTLWEMVSDPAARRNYGQDSVTDEQVADLRSMAAETGGWIRWRDDGEDPALPAAEWGPAFTPLAEWLPMYERRMAEWEKLRADLKTPNV